MTRGATAKYADTVYARWIEKELHTREWNKTRLAEEIVKLAKAAGEEKTQSGTYRMVIRVTKDGTDISPENREWIARVLGAPRGRRKPMASPAEEMAEVLLRLGRLEAALDGLGTELRRIAALVDQGPHVAPQVQTKKSPGVRRRKTS